jgi:hypothetical protein
MCLYKRLFFPDDGQLTSNSMSGLIKPSAGCGHFLKSSGSARLISHRDECKPHKRAERNDEIDSAKLLMGSRHLSWNSYSSESLTRREARRDVAPIAPNERLEESRTEGCVFYRFQKKCLDSLIRVGADTLRLATEC